MFWRPCRCPKRFSLLIRTEGVLRSLTSTEQIEKLSLRKKEENVFEGRNNCKSFDDLMFFCSAAVVESHRNGPVL